jgi:hypothetical protein
MLCWGYHCSVVPDDAEEIIDKQGRHWHRAGARAWALDGEGDSYHESWILREHGPVACNTVERRLAERDAQLAAQLGPAAGWFVKMPETADELVFEDAMMLMRAGWLIWSPKQRREAVTALDDAEQRELAVTS